MKVNLDISVIQGKAIEAFQETCYIVHREMIQLISEPGAFDGFPGDIVDTGNLRASQQPPQFNGTAEAVFVNTAEYALVIHEGADFKAGETWEVKEHQRTIKQAFGKPIEEKTVTVKPHTATRKDDRRLEGRPWMTEAINRVDAQATFNQLLQDKLQ